MNRKCSKYESLFIFSDSETLKKHVEECEECRAEQEKMDKVSSLLDEVKFYYKAKKRNSYRRLKTACALAVLAVSFLSIGIAFTNEDLTETLMYGTTLSAEDLGFPVDSYGLLMVDEE